MPAYYLETIVVSIGLLMLLIEAFAPVRDKRSIAWLGVLGIIVVLCLLFKIEPHAAPADGGEAHVFWTFYSDDGLALFFKGLTLVCTLIVLLMSVDFAPTLKRYLAPGEPGAPKDAGVGEFYALPIFVCAGLMWMASATHLVSIFVALETVTIGFYVLVAYMRRNVASLEAGVKYLILGALSTGFLVYGFTWLYGITGEFELGKIAAALASEETAAGQGPQLFAFALILIALGFKIGAVPFQLWIPDVYQGAPTPVTAFLSVGSKAAGFVVLIRLAQVFLESGAIAGQTLSIFVIIAGATLVYGNLAALPQTNFKRLLAYSSISHAGFLLMALTASEKYRESSTPAISFYLAAYLAMTLLAFLVMVAVRNHSDSDELSAYNGLGKRSPFLAVTLTIAMASLAGVPLTAGFFGKFFVFQVAIQDKHYLLLAIGIVAAAAGFYYYFKVIRAMYWEQPSASAAAASDDGTDSTAMEPAPVLSAATRFVAVVLMIAVVVFGFYPQGILNLLN